MRYQVGSIREATSKILFRNTCESYGSLHASKIRNDGDGTAQGHQININGGRAGKDRSCEKCCTTRIRNFEQ